ncbi:hypothetical protein KP004_05605 [Geomonas oryzisoli]|uniref:Uncharacterized protein n=1 Tax=Geomonas oryzisoli TaxID=2847992 RepID=A0ABX8JC00_9BACT|nr:hypothetical protein [Geomonas oryzisoli]QWV94657.1 hypothetical protein KP004_05605 [Geomonas oryzisoli]
MDNRELMKSLSRLGLPMFEPDEALDVNETVAEVVKNGDGRLWELFPVLLANASEDYRFSFEKVRQRLPEERDRHNLNRLCLLSLSLYALYHLEFTWAAKYKKELPPKEKEQVKAWRKDLESGQPVTWEGAEFSPERLKKNFELYVEQNAERTRRRKERYDEFSLAFALSQVFSPKQTDLFRRKLEGLPMTKTEQEYYSRSVKKKVLALANAELHALARKLLEQ